MVEKLKKLDKMIKELRKVITSLSQLALEIGTLVAIIKMVLDSL